MLVLIWADPYVFSYKRPKTVQQPHLAKMLDKIRLDAKAGYELSFVTACLSRMIAAMIEGRPGDLAIGREQGGILGWDDIVILSQGGNLVHHQAKYQQTDFSPVGNANRTQRTRGAKAGVEQQKMTPLDEAMKAIALWYQGSHSPNDDRQFILLVPNSVVQIKKQLQVRHLLELAEHCKIKATTVAGLSSRASSSGSTQLLFQWLTTWCEFGDWEHILRALRNFSVRSTGLVADLDIDAERSLAEHFADAPHARKALAAFILENTIDTGPITPRLALTPMMPYLLEDLGLWTLFGGPKSNSEDWHVAGTTALTCSEFEPTDRIVAAFWSKEGIKVQLFVQAGWPQVGTGCNRLVKAIGRLALHLGPNTQGVFENLAQWKERILVEVGGTLGVDSAGPFGAWCESKVAREFTDKRSLNTLDEQRQEASDLNRHMDALLLNSISNIVIIKINEIESSEFRKLMSTIWSDWRSALAADDSKLRQVFATFLNPKAERRIDGLLRAGPKSCIEISEALVMLLALAAVSEHEVSSFDNIAGVSVASIAARYWSGPGSTDPRIRRVDEDSLDIVAREQARLVVMSGVESAPTSIRQESLAHDAIQRNSMAEVRTPALITNDSTFRKKLRVGDREWISDHLKSELRIGSDSAETHISMLTRGNE